MSRIIVITSGKGGVGKSTISANLSYSICDLGYKVCLIDADFGLKNLDVLLGLENRVIYDLKDVMMNRCSLKQVLIKDKRKENLYLLPACKSMSFEELNIENMVKMMDILKEDFDYILLDSPAGVEKGFLYASGLADEAVVVVTLDVASLRDADRVIGILNKEGIDNIKMIVNKYNNDDVEKGRCMLLKEAYDILSVPLLGIVYDDHCIIESNNTGKPISLNKSDEIAQCFHRISLRLDGQEVPFKKQRKIKFIKKIFS